MDSKGTSLVLAWLLTLAVEHCSPDSMESICRTSDGHEQCHGGNAWPLACNSALAQEHSAQHCDKQPSSKTARYLVLLNSWEKLTWASIGFRRVLASSLQANISLIEPCVWQGEVGGFLRPGALELSTYWDIDNIRHELKEAGSMDPQAALVPAADYVREARCRWTEHKTGKTDFDTGMPQQDSATIMDALMLFVWWQEREKFSFDRSGLVNCVSHFNATGKIDAVHFSDNGYLYRLPDLDDGTGGTIEIKHLMFRSVYCADPYVARDGAISRATWLHEAFNHMRPDNTEDGESFAVGIAGYRRMALIMPDEPEWGKWPMDAHYPRLLAVHPALQKIISSFKDNHLPRRYLSVHLRAGRIFNKGTIMNDHFKRQRYDASTLERVINYPIACAHQLVRRAHELMAAFDLQGVYLASDLDELKMPELHRAETQPPLLLSEEREIVLQNIEEAAWILKSELSSVEFSTVDFADQLQDLVGMSAIIDAELLSGAAFFLHAGQYSGNCVPTGYSSSILERRRILGMGDAQEEYLRACCIL